LKQAYISLVLPLSKKKWEVEDVIRIDSALKKTSRNHEIILITEFGAYDGGLHSIALTGPLSIISTNSTSTKNSQRVAALGRAVGDFVIEWSGDVSLLTEEMIVDLLDPTGYGVELIEFESTFQSSSSRFFYRFVNSFRSSSIPIRKTVARALSRRAVGQILSASGYEPQIDVLFAELPAQRTTRVVNVDFATKLNMKERVFDGVALVVKGSRFGTVVPLVFATLSALFGVFVVVYAFGLYLIQGKSPAGWTSLMVVTGFGQASILALMGMTWTRIDSLIKGLSRSSDATVNVIVLPPRE
jgi:hypothetical protein